MTVSGADLAARQLQAAGIDTVFGVLAGPMVPVFESLAAAGVRVVGCRHEERAGFMAQAWGFLRHRPGVVVVGSGPAMTNTVTAMYVAQQNCWPLVVLGGTVASWEQGAGGFQEAPQRDYAAPACKWHAQVDCGARIPELLRMALGRATAGRPGPAYLDFPAQTVLETVSEDAARDLVRPLTAPGRPFPDPEDVTRAAELLGAAARPLVVAGKGAVWAGAGDGLHRLADLGLPFVAGSMARGLVPDDHPSQVGAARSAALRDADVVLALGTRFNWMLSAWDRFGGGEPPGARVIQVDIAAEELHAGTDVDVAIVADAAATAHALADALEQRRAPAARATWLAALRERADANIAKLDARVNAATGPPLTQLALFGTLRELLAPDAIVVTDGEATLAGGRLLLSAREPQTRLDCGSSGCMGVGVPFAIGAKLARPERQVVAVLGDYAFGGPAMEIETAMRARLDITFVVANNAGIVGHSLQDAVFGPAGQPVGSLLPARYERLGEMVGAFHAHVAEPRELRAAFEAALGHRGPAVVNVALDPLDHGVLQAEAYLTSSYAMRPRP